MMNVFEDPALKLEHYGRIRKRKSAEIASSPLSVGFECLDRDLFKPELCYDRMADAGVKWARCQTGWVKCEKTRGVYDFAWLDEVVDELLKRSIQPWFNLGFGNPLYMPGVPVAAVGCVPTEFGEECLVAWKNFVRALVVHFEGRVTHYEIWNEPDINQFWYPSKASGGNYAGLVAATAPVIRAASPGALTMGCSSGGGFTEPFNTGYILPFLQEALENGIGDHLDIWSLHPYQPIPEIFYEDNLRAIRRLFRRYAPHIRLWQGECGYPSQTYNHHDDWMKIYNANENTQAKFLIRRFFLDAAAGMGLISYFHIADLMEKPYRQADGKARHPVMLGLLHGLKYTPKRSFTAFQSMAALFDADTCAEDLFLHVEIGNYNQRQQGVIPALALKTSRFLRRGYPMYAWYYPEDLQREWTPLTNITICAIPDAPEKITSPVLFDPLTGDLYRVTDWSSADGKLLFRGLPLTDYPLLLTDEKALEKE